MPTALQWAAIALCVVFPGITVRADPLPAAAATPSYTVAPGCPSQISIENGNFETGNIHPWQIHHPNGGVLNSTVVLASPGTGSGGTNNKYYLEVNFEATTDNFGGFELSWSLDHLTTGKLCYGFYYNVSYAWNWANYTGPVGPPADPGTYDPSCSFSVDPSYYGSATTYYGNRTAGWRHGSYVFRHTKACGSIRSHFGPFVGCFGRGRFPAFTILIDEIKIELLDRSRFPPPKSFKNCQACGKPSCA